MDLPLPACCSTAKRALPFSRGLRPRCLAQKAAEKFQTTETAWHESFERARRMRQLLSAQEPDADPRAVATTLLYVAQDLFWQSSLSSAVQAPANGQAE